MHKLASRPHADDNLTFPVVICCCGTRHRTTAAMARCYLGLGRGDPVAGTGEYAVIHYYWCACCGHTVNVRLYPDKSAAVSATRDILRWHSQSGKCSGSCTGERPGLLRFVLK